MHLPDKLNGFKLLEQKYSSETSSEAYVYKHEKTQATLVYLANDEANRTFAVGFRTPPEDSSGIAHILEHSVLSGSEKFRTKEPFMDLIQGSLQTFLNAMTFADMTIYPVSSKNPQDFRNLLEVYLDAVFFPLVHERPMIFQQEGWHYELEDQDSPLIYNGVVYNEMRGAYSSPEAYNLRQVIKTLYPESTYAHESGGDPWEIPKLKYEDFLNFHERLYHPSNALFFLYGDCDFEDITALIDRDYLQRFEAIDPQSEIVKGRPLAEPKRAEFSYNAEAGQTAEGDSYLSYAVPVGQATDNKSRFILGLLNRILLYGEDAPLRRAIIESGLGEDVDALSVDIFYLTFGLMIKKAKASDLEKFKEVVERVLREEVEKGLDRDLVLASLNKEEMDMRELGGAQRGVILMILTMYAQRYDLDPLSFISYNEVLEEVRSEIDKGLLEDFIQQKILDNPACLLSVHKPEEGLYAAFDAQQKAELEAKKASLSEAELEEVISNTKALMEYQQSPSSPEDKATIPSLKLSELKTVPTKIAEEIIEADEISFHLHPAKAGGLCYNSLFFPLHGLSLDELYDLSLMARLLAYVSAGKLSYGKLDTELSKYSSGLRFAPIFAKNPEGKIERYLGLNFVTIGNQSQAMLPLLRSVLLESDFSDLKRIRELFQQLKLQSESAFNRSSHVIGLGRVFAQVSAVDRLEDESGGLGFYFRLSEYLADDQALAAFAQRLPALAAKVFQKSGLVISLTADASALDELRESYRELSQKLDSRPLAETTLELELRPRREAFTTSTGINYVQVGQNFKELGYDYHPGMEVLSNLLSINYLHGLVRAQGGAYGVGNPIREDGAIGFFSYRDPQLKRTYEIYHTIPETIKALELEPADLEKAIIGTINRFDPVITPAMINGLMFSRKLRGRDYSYNVKMLDELVKTELSELHSYAELYSEALNKEGVVVIGDEQAINENRELFDIIRPLKQ
ncbi:MAG: insulinase family protein [Eubacteriales bacterium]|nr:insulinase family protein [Eubacteriales bacterium]